MRRVRVEGIITPVNSSNQSGSPFLDFRKPEITCIWIKQLCFFFRNNCYIQQHSNVSHKLRTTMTAIPPYCLHVSMNPGEGAAKIETSFHSELLIFIAPNERIQNKTEVVGSPLVIRHCYGKCQKDFYTDSL